MAVLTYTGGFLCTCVDEYLHMQTCKNILHHPKRLSFYFKQVPFKLMQTQLRYRCDSQTDGHTDGHTDRQIFSFKMIERGQATIVQVHACSMPTYKLLHLLSIPSFLT